jgi:hypothetical protein
MYFYILILCLNTMTSMIKTNVFFRFLLIFSATELAGVDGPAAVRDEAERGLGGTAVATELAREIGAGGVFGQTGKKKRGHDAATNLPWASGEKKGYVKSL